jgi:signal transduction histidine kinase
MIAAACCGDAVMAQPEQPFAAHAAKVRAQIMADPRVALSRAMDLRKVAVATADPHERLSRVAVADWLRAEALLDLNRPREARDILSRALTSTSELGAQTELRARLTMARGGAAKMLGRVQDALLDNQTAFRLFGATGNARGQAVALQNIGTIYYDARDYPNAIRYARQSIEIYHDDPLLLVSAWNNLGNAYLDSARYDRAERQYQRALEAAQRTRSTVLVTRVLQNLARAQAEAGKLDTASATLDRAYRIASDGPALAWRPALDGVAALVALRRSDLNEASLLIDRALIRASSTSATLPLRDFHRTAYEIYRREGNAGKALHHLEVFEKLDNEARSLAASTSAALMGARFDFANQNLKIAELRAGQAERDATIVRANVRFRDVLMKGLLSTAVIITVLLGFGFFSIRRSRNQVRAANAQLTESNTALGKALAAKTEFLATTSHEIRTPLNGMLGMTQVILAGDQVDAALRSRIELIHGAGETMRALVDDILDMAKIETGELRIHPAAMDLHRLLGEAAQVWNGQAETKRIAIELDLGDLPARIVADEVRLRQIVFNLMSNAIKFTDRGCVRLCGSVERGDTGELLRIAVADSGIGIPPDRMEDIFESFSQVDGGVTRRHGGTGLGLAICRNLARKMGGDVTLDSILGTGSTFTLTLPLERVEAPQERGPKAEVQRLQDAALLVVDGNPLAQGILRAALGGQTASLDFASNVDDALVQLAASNIDHVVADAATFSLDMDVAATLAAAAEKAGSRLTLLWPAPTSAQLAELQQRGIDHILAKPMPVTELLPALRNRYGVETADREIAA